ncbi:MAG TPA: LON peptidase substrate-binding domain-containing protein [Pyrinomonadaceae bacterium]|jgi:ATP-dependent Lon protease
MHKKDAKKRKKLINQIRHHRVLPDGRVLAADGRETLLGNLAPVKHIPMLPWKRVMMMPTMEKTITISTEGENAWIYRLFEDVSKKSHDLVGFTPVRELSATGFADVAVGSIGIAAQVCEIEPAESGKARVRLKGVCRYENTGFLPSAEDHFRINVRWFEDTREADTHVRPQYVRCLEIIEFLSKAVGAQTPDYFRASKNAIYNHTAAQYLSFIFIDGFGDWFSEAEKWEMLRLRSTAVRLQKICERSKKFL